MYFVYVLWSEKLQKRYIGSTRCIKKRLQEHNRKGHKFTSGGIPWKLVHSESYETICEARVRELFLKTGVGRKWLDYQLSKLL